MSKVVGIADLVAWQENKSVFHELSPAAVKKLIVGSGKSSKADVAKSLNAFVGEKECGTNDESDAVAVGIAWLLQNYTGEISRAFQGRSTKQ